MTSHRYIPKNLSGEELVHYGATPKAKADAQIVLANIALSLHPESPELAEECLRSVLDTLGLLPRSATPSGMCGCGCGHHLSWTDRMDGKTVRPICRARKGEAS